MDANIHGHCLWDFSVSGIATHVDKEEDIEPEECSNRILIVRSPTPGFILHMMYAKGVITETGGILCHVAVLAMEIGCPIIVGADDALKFIKNGAWVTMVGEGGNGTIYQTLLR